MTAQWIQYDGSDKQIAEIVASRNGVKLRYVNGNESSLIIRPATEWQDHSHVQDCIKDNLIDYYLICEPHHYADMICQWARTGQPVWVRYAKVCHFGQTSEYEICNQIATPTPNWNIPGAEYSFTPFEGEV